MALDRKKVQQHKMFFSFDEMPKTPGHVFYDRLQSILIKKGFDEFVQEQCEPYYAVSGRPSIPPGRYFRMHLVGFFEGLESERGIQWRCADSISLRNFLLLDSKEAVPDHSCLSRIRSRLPLELHEKVFDWVLRVIAEAGLIKGDQIGIDASTMEANAAMRNIKRRDTGEGYRQMLRHMAEESGLENPSHEDLSRMDRKRKGKKVSNEDWESPSDPEAKITKLIDGRTRLAYKPEHAVDLDSGAVVATEVHPADEGDTKTLDKTLGSTSNKLSSLGKAPITTDPTELIADKGYHSRNIVKELNDGLWKTRIAEPKTNSLHCRRGDHETRRAVYNNRQRLKSGKGRQASKRRTELVERSFQHVLDRGPMRKTWLRGRENVQKRYLLVVAGFNLSLLMKKLTGYGTPKGAAEAWNCFLIAGQTRNFVFCFIRAAHEDTPNEVCPLALIAMPVF